MGRRGRPPKLNPETQAAFMKAIESGATQEMAAAHAGVSRKTALDWMAKGRKQKAGIYCDFLDAYTRARDKAGLRWLAKVQQLADAKQDWRAYKWLLEVNFPQHFGPNADFESEAMSQASAAVRLMLALTGTGGLDHHADADLMAGAPEGRRP